MSLFRVLALSLSSVLLFVSSALAGPSNLDLSSGDGDKFDEVIIADLGAASSQAAMEELDARLKQLSVQEKKVEKELVALEKQEEELKKLEATGDRHPLLKPEVRDFRGAPPGLGTLGDDRIAEMTSRLFELIEGNAGALVMVLAGIAALISAAFGAYRAAVSLLVVAVGAFILRSLVEIFFNYTG